MEQAMGDLESAKSRLLSENDALRDVVLSAARGLHSLVHELELKKTEVKTPSFSLFNRELTLLHPKPPPLLTPAELFSPSNDNPSSLYDAAAQALNAHARLREFINTIRSRVDTLQNHEVEFQLGERDREKWVKEKEGTLVELRKAQGEAERLARELGEFGPFSLMALYKVQDINWVSVLFSASVLHLAEQISPKAGPSRTAHSANLAKGEEAARRLKEKEAALDREQAEFAEAAARLGEERAALEVRSVRSLWKALASLMYSLVLTG